MRILCYVELQDRCAGWLETTIRDSSDRPFYANLRSIRMGNNLRTCSLGLRPEVAGMVSRQYRKHSPSSSSLPNSAVSGLAGILSRELSVQAMRMSYSLSLTKPVAAADYADSNNQVDGNTTFCTDAILHSDVRDDWIASCWTGGGFFFVQQACLKQEVDQGY